MLKDDFNLYNFVNMAWPKNFVQIVDPYLLTREVATEDQDDYHNNIEAGEEIVIIEILSQMNSNVKKCLLSVFKIGSKMLF